MPPLDLYHLRLAEGALHPDPHQAQAVGALQELSRALQASPRAACAPTGWLTRFTGSRDVAQEEILVGVYLYGPVGRGKTAMMDLFYQSLPAEILKCRTHFHAFMVRVHDFLHAQRQAAKGEGVSALLPRFAAQIAGECRVLCFDEFHVLDVADAMILQRLFTALFSAGVRVVMTSNWAPDDLYPGGLQRDRFLPFIDLLKTRMQVVPVAGETDYRLSRLLGRAVYFSPLSSPSETEMDRLFFDLTDGNAVPDWIDVKGRRIEIPFAACGVARAPFSSLCERALGAEDYLALAARYHTLFLERIPRLTYDRRNEAKRLMILVDVFYERHRRLVVSADAEPDSLYVGEDHAFEFQRTVSRLKEMQSQSYLRDCAGGDLSNTMR